MRFRLTTVIGRALEAARKALRDLDPAQVPASLRRVAGHSGDLTPPLADRLARELDALEWLRARALEAWPDADASETAPERASALFLSRPEGWVIEFLGAASETATAAGRDDGERTGRERATMEKEIAAARSRERRWRKRAETAEAEARDARRRSAEPARADRSEAERVRGELARRRDAWAGERARLEDRLSHVEAELGMLRGELHRVRRDRAALVSRLEEVRAGPGWAERDPVSLATFLDDAAAQARPPRAPAAPPPPRVRGMSLPAGVRPDEARAVDAVLAYDGPLLVLVDGYNAGLAMTRGTPSEVRARVTNMIERLVVVSPPALRVCVVWDSSLETATMERMGRLEVRFAEPGRSADDVVVEIAGGSDIPVVVVSNDRDVRLRVEGLGATALWSDALAKWGLERR